MYSLALCTLLITLFYYPAPLAGYGEPDASGHPVYQERANHVFLNAVRVAPSQYKTVYMAGYSPSPAGILGSTYPAVAPLYLEPKLDASSYYHSNDMATNGCFQHPSCDGTDTFVRIQSYYTCSGTMGENIAAGYADPLDTSNQWLCDSTGSACAADGSGSDGHRSNMMSASYKAVGIGYAYNSAATYRYYWTQDFGGAVCSPVPTNAIFSGSHWIKSGTNKFIAVYYVSSGTAPSSATVVIAGTSHALTLDIGSAGKATYAYSESTGTACRSYYFQIGTYRYPDTGCLVTYGEGSCTTSFDATCGGTTVATSTVATTAASSTTATSKSATTTTTSTTKSATTTTTTSTTKSATSTTGTTGTGSYFLYDHALENGWITVKNSGLTLSTTATYSGQTCISAAFTTSSSTNFFFLQHTPAVTKTWTTLSFYAAASSSATLYYYFNGYYLQSKALTTSWQFVSISLATMNAPATLGNPAQLVFQNGNSGSTAYTLYLYNVQFA